MFKRMTILNFAEVAVLLDFRRIYFDFYNKTTRSFIEQLQAILSFRFTEIQIYDLDI